MPRFKIGRLDRYEFLALLKRGLLDINPVTPNLQVLDRLKINCFDLMSLNVLI